MDNAPGLAQAVRTELAMMDKDRLRRALGDGLYSELMATRLQECGGDNPTPTQIVDALIGFHAEERRTLQTIWERGTEDRDVRWQARRVVRLERTLRKFDIGFRPFSGGDADIENEFAQLMGTKRSAIYGVWVDDLSFTRRT